MGGDAADGEGEEGIEGAEMEGVGFMDVVEDVGIAGIESVMVFECGCFWNGVDNRDIGW